MAVLTHSKSGSLLAVQSVAAVAEENEVFELQQKI